MNKFSIQVFIALLLLLAQVSSVAADNSVNIVVVGDISHGPMQPTVKAIKNVTAKYGDMVNVTWMDMGTSEGSQYAQEHGLTAHLNILINGNYHYTRNGKEIVFQWFEGQQWTKEDLDAVIAGILSNNSSINTVDQSKVPVSPTSIAVYALIVLSLGVLLILLIKRYKKDQQKKK
jgi:hypothetical protein